ncbi:unnamed protein product [Staurois parvus]|uniref:Uncharacterized protein n=1 Tax=Staurois parvus TaxID=386267 RepID=A0ABN9D618_9NEOB|nr:unnamed protein product [Staurois parvus]
MISADLLCDSCRLSALIGHGLDCTLDTADHMVKGCCDWPFTSSCDQLCP